MIGPRVLAVASGKGGVGKTSTALALAAIYAEAGGRVLVVDLDPQASASSWLAVEHPGGPSLVDVLAGEAQLDQLARPSPWAGVDVVPAAAGLAGAERALAGQPMAALGLRRAVGRAGGRWRWILADCGPGLGLLTTSAVAASTTVLATTEAGMLGLAGLVDLAELVEGIGDHVTPAPRLVAVLPCKVDARLRLTRAALEALRGRWAGLVLDPIPATVRLAEAAALRQPITTFDPEGTATLAYRAAAVEIERRLADGSEG